MEILLLCGIYLVETVCYQFGIRLLFEVRHRAKAGIILCLGLFLPVLIGFLPIEVSGKNVLVSLSVIGVTFVSMEGNVKEKCVRLVLAFLLLATIDTIFTRPFERILKYISSVHIRNLEYLFCKCCTASSLLFMNVVKVKINQHKKGHINSVIYFIIGIIAASMMFCLQLLNHVKINVDNNKFIIICNILNIVIHISIVLLVVFVVYIKNTHERMEQLLKTEQILKEAQVNYYKQNLKKEADTRQYRHDMVNHLVYVQELLSNQKQEEVQTYLSSILGGFKGIQNIYYVIGNEMVNTIMNYFFAMLPNNVDIVINRKCPVELDVKDTDICTIFSNIFQNAVEEIMLNNMKKARIIVDVSKGREYVEYCIKNSLYEKIIDSNINKNGLLKSRKLDKRNHGIGMANVKKAVEQNHGSFKWFQEDGYFCVCIVLPIK